MATRKRITYAAAGVSIDEADRAVAQIKEAARATMTKQVLAGIGSFGAGFALKGYQEPVLVSSADGVGTKLKVAQLAGRHDTIGEDLVNHCVNDIMVQGAVPLFFLDYFAMGRLDADVAGAVVRGIARGCQANGCALIGGETAEMPGLYAPGDYDLAGFIVGAVERKQLLTGKAIKAGDVLVALPSTGLHTNGYSLARKVLFEHARHAPSTVLPELGTSVGEELLKVHRSYKAPLLGLMKAGLLKGAAHITGGGITENTPRMLPAGVMARIDLGTWEVPPVFRLLQRLGDVPDDDFRRTLNLGVGMIVAVAKTKLAAAEKVLKRLREPHWVIGGVVPLKRRGAPRVEYV